MVGTNNIEALRGARGWSRPELGRRMNTSGQQVERLEKGQRKLSQEWMERAAKALEVSISDIISESDPIDGRYLKSIPSEGQSDAGGVATAMRLAPGSDVCVAVSRDAGEAVQITQLDLSLPMGQGATVDDYIEEEIRLFDLAYIRSFTRTPPERLRIARGVGDSMFPTLLSNDLVWIDSTQRQLNQADRVWAVSINGMAAIKRLRRLKEGKVLVVSDNKTVGDYEVDEEDILIGGRVIRFSRDI